MSEQQTIFPEILVIDGYKFGRYSTLGKAAIYELGGILVRVTPESIDTESISVVDTTSSNNGGNEDVRLAICTKSVLTTDQIERMQYVLRKTVSNIKDVMFRTAEPDKQDKKLYNQLENTEPRKPKQSKQEAYQKVLESIDATS